MQLLPFQHLLLGFRLGLRDVGGLLRRVWAVAVNGRTLRGGHLWRTVCLWTRYRLLLLKLLHLGRKLLLALPVVRILPGLYLLHRFEARHLLRIRS